jgi:hypothetical protein
MTQKEIQERNKQIALMLGWSYITWQEASKLADSSIKPGWWSVAPKKSLVINRYNFYKGRSHNHLRFNFDWNWLIKAIQFLQNHFESKEMIWTSIQRHTLFTDIETVFITVSDYAKLYNEGKL